MSEKSEFSLSELVAISDHETLRARIEAGDDINAEDPKSGDTALDTACFMFLKNTIQYLLDNGADPNKQHRVTGSTPLHKLVSSHNASKPQLYDYSVALAKLLMSKGADPGIPNKNGRSAYAEIAGSRNKGLAAALREGCAVEKVPMPKLFIPRLIGTAGRQIQQFKRKYGVIIDVPKASTEDPVNVEFIGTKANIEAALEEVKKMLDSWNATNAAVQQRLENRKHGDTTVTLPISHEHFMFIIGKNGSVIKDLEARHNVIIDVITGDKSAGTEDGVFVVGHSDNVVAASSEILQLAAKKPHTGSKRGGRGGRGGRGRGRGGRGGRGGRSDKSPSPTPADAEADTEADSGATAGDSSADAAAETTKDDGEATPEEKKESEEKSDKPKRDQRRPRFERRQTPVRQLMNAGVRLDYHLHQRPGQTPGVSATEPEEEKKTPQRKPVFEDFVALK